MSTRDQNQGTTTALSRLISDVADFFPGPVRIDNFKYDHLSQNDADEDMDETAELKKLKNLPYFLNPYIPPNAGAFLSYFNVGIAIYLLITPLSVYIIDDLNISSIQYNAYVTIISLPWSFKFMFGTLSDTVPVLGYRRKSWLFCGWTIFISLAFYMSSLDMPQFPLLAAITFLMTCAYLLADVVHDAMCVERARAEYEEIKGSIQTTAYTIRSYGGVIGAILGSLLYNTEIWGWGLTISQLFLLAGLIPLVTLMPMLWPLEEITSTHKSPTLTEIGTDIWNTLCLRAVWWPMCFIYTYSLFQIPNGAWNNFLVLGLKFTDFELGLIQIAGAILYWFGMITFKMFFFESSWRKIYVFTTCVNVTFSLLQVMLILRWNVALGIPDIVFALGDSAVVYFMIAINSMPSCIMFVMLCPEGSEGVTYALLTTLGNLAYTCAYDIGSALTYIFDVSNHSLRQGDFSGILYLTLLTSFLQVVPLALVWILPDSRHEQRILRDSGVRSWWGGMGLVSVIICSLLGTIIFNSILIFT